jgi:hypothetical protein
VNSLDDQDLLLGLDFSKCLGDQTPLAGGNLTRFQRASEGSDESAGSTSNDVIERSGARRKGIRRDVVVFSNRAVNAKRRRLTLPR